MIVSITCPCGHGLAASTLLHHAPLACSKCGLPNTVRLPVAGIVARQPSRTLPNHDSQKGVVPEWIVAPILTWLAFFGGLIILVGWFVVQPSSLPTAARESEPVVVAKSKIATVKVAAARMDAERAAQVEVVVEPLRIESWSLPRRRIAVNEDVPLAPVIEEKAIPKNELPPAAAKAALLTDWTLDDKIKSSVVETAKGESNNLHFSLRRLRLAGDAPKPLKLAVTPAAHDDIASILAKFGEGYRFTTLRNQDLLSLQTLRSFDVLFLTCADVYAHDFQAALPLRKFVELGGTLYASDLRGDIVLAAFPEFRARMPALPGVPQEVEATVTDRGLQAYLNRSHIPLTFDAPGWRPAAFSTAKTTVCLKGRYRNQLGEDQIAPLLVKFQVQRGTVIFTSFHHTKNDTAIVQKLLDYLVFASVNARSEARVRELMERYEFAPSDLRPTVLNARQNHEATFQHPGGGLQIALGFENQGAQLKLVLRSPTGQTIEHEDQGIYLIEVPNAAPGVWQYTISPVALPHANFPIVVAVGALKS